ncbi:hypothetical protein RND71_042363 [Anisodus tanguticus]|uniref:Uncharacterized protein n=1 Tax=Anisodus tanguticus TaxID=243964 RepID=A0AAE1QRA7_9SOLA|nr:hypothetical protein RND71_042363 [Anisodus tanguticus]
MGPENAMQLPQKVIFQESNNTQWTDEKHSLYLKYMETSFVNQLYGSLELCGRHKCSSEPKSSQQKHATPSGQVWLNCTLFRSLLFTSQVRTESEMQSIVNLCINRKSEEEKEQTLHSFMLGTETT